MVEPIVVIGNPERVAIADATRAIDEIYVHDATLAAAKNALRDTPTCVFLVHHKHNGIGMKPSSKGIEEDVHTIEEYSSKYPWYTYNKETHADNNTQDAAAEHQRPEHEIRDGRATHMEHLVVA